MENEKSILALNLADNISYYRKKMHLTQAELASKLNYSDKSISKWERAEGVPDIYVIKELSSFFGLSIDQLVSKRTKKFSLLKYKYILAYFYASIIWLIGGISFGVLSILKIDYPAWHALVFSIPASSLVLFCFFLVWKKIRLIYLYMTIFIWSLAISIQLVINIENDYWVYIIFVPIYLFIGFMLFVILKPKKIK